MRHEPAKDGFLHKGQIVYAMQCGIADGSSLIVWLDPRRQRHELADQTQR
jgi:hypothetical protein